jgi:hypothetical protein
MTEQGLGMLIFHNEIPKCDLLTKININYGNSKISLEY